MDIRKLQDAVDELEAEGARCLQLANELKAAIKRSMNGGAHPAAQPLKAMSRLQLKPKAPDESCLTLAVDVLREHEGPMHISDIVPLVAGRRSKDTPRNQVEAALVRGLKTKRFRGMLKRTAPGTYAVSQQ